MTKNVILKCVFTVLLFPLILLGQDLKLKSKVELRNWKLSSRALKSESFLSTASVKLLKENAVISEAKTDAEGNFELNIPSDGQYTLLIEYPGREPKKFAVNTKATSPNTNDANFKPSVDIVGILMSKPKKGMESIGLNHPMVIKSGKNEHLRTNIYDGEYKLIQKFCTANKLGDMALENKNFSLAKTFYAMASDMIDSEDYPKEQMKKAEEGMKIEKASRKKVRSKQTKTKSAITTKSGTNKSTNSGSKSSSVETGKSTRKTRKVLGK